MQPIRLRLTSEPLLLGQQAIVMRHTVYLQGFGSSQISKRIATLEVNVGD
jgi:hypothetical protein